MSATLTSTRNAMNLFVPLRPISGVIIIKYVARRGALTQAAGTGTEGETPAWQTNFPTVRFFAFTRTEFVPLGIVFGSWPDNDQFPLVSDVEPSSVVRTTPFASRS